MAKFKENANVILPFDNYGVPKNTQIFYTSLSLLILTSFAIWWFQPNHIPYNFLGFGRIFDILLFLSVTFIIWHPLLMDILAWMISSHIKDVKQQKPAAGAKVAFITTIVPSSEPLALLHKCLPAMVAAKYPHDTWLLDEGDNPEVKAICAKYGVYHFSRKNRTEFNHYGGKFTKTKGGNHNSWYEAYGNQYDFVAQIDTDFVPKNSFLTKTLGYFRDQHVAFVGTPQVYGNTDSVIAQGAAEQQYTHYGPVLRGLSSMDTTLLVGANHVIRVNALKSVNHYSAHITEDLITGMKLHSKGWKSIYISTPLAVGEGPTTWESYFSQQMRWAYGCIDILLHHSPKLFKKMGFRRAIYYFLLQQHYFSGIAMALSTILLTLYFGAGLRAANIDLRQFCLFYSIVLLTSWLMSVWLQRYEPFSKKGGDLLLKGKIISIAAWPVWFLASVSALFRARLSYKVTPKGENDAATGISLQVFFPHFLFGAIALLCIISSFYTGRQSSAMLFWAVMQLSLIHI